MPSQLSLSTVLQHGVAQAYGVLGSWLRRRAGHGLAACLWAELWCLHGTGSKLTTAGITVLLWT